MRETDLTIRIELNCEDEFDFRARDLAEAFRGEFVLPTTELLDADDVVQVELVYRDGKVGVLGTACILGAGSGGYLAKFLEISLGEIELVEEWDDTVPPSLVPREQVRQHEEEPAAPKRSRARVQEPAPPPQTSEPPAKRSRRGSAMTGTRSASGKSSRRGQAPERRRRRTSGGLPRTHRLAPVRLTGLPQSPEIEAAREAARAQIAARQRRKMLIQTAALALAAVAVVVVVFIVRSSGDSSESKRETTRAASPRVTGEPSDELSSVLAVADQRMAEGRIAGPGGDQALDHLLAARELGPGDPGVQRRLDAIADKFEQLAAEALADDSPKEAAAHLRVVVIADPSRESAKKQLQDLADKLGDPALAAP